jgi:Ca2+-dependent lipid-binding protein
LHLEIISASGLPSVETVTDPYIAIRQNGIKICKTSVQRQTLEPVFKETFKITVHSRIHSILYLICKDHNQLQADVLLGSFTFPLDCINTSGDWISFDMPIAGCSGEIKTKYRFEAKPLSELGIEVENTVEEATTAGNFAKLGKTIQSGVDKILEHGVTEQSNQSLSNLISDDAGTVHSHHKSLNIINSINSGASNLARKIKHVPDSILNKTFVNHTVGPIVKIEIVGAKDLKAVDHHQSSSDPYVRVTIHSEKVHKTAFVLKSLSPVWKNESFETDTTESIKFTIKDKNQITADVELGYVKFDIKTVMDEKPIVDSWFPITAGKGSLHLIIQKL